MQGNEPQMLGEGEASHVLSYRAKNTSECQAYFRDLSLLIQAAFNRYPLPKLLAYAGDELLAKLSRLETVKSYVLSSYSYEINRSNRVLMKLLGLLYNGDSYHCTYLDFHETIWIYDYVAQDGYSSAFSADKSARFVLDLSNIPPELAALAKGPKEKEVPVKEVLTFEVAYGAEVLNRLKRVESFISQIDRMDLSEQETACVATLHQKLRDVSDSGGGGKYSRRKVEKQITAIEKDIEKFHAQKSKDVLASMRAQTVFLRDQITAQA